MVQINWSNQVFEEINDIAEYLSKGSEKLAATFVDKLFEKVELLKTYPRMGRIVPEFSREPIRELLYKQYRIIYRIVSEKKIIILSVQHSSHPLSEDSIFD